MYLIVGLGNPGNEHVDTRHNIGFTILDEIFEFNDLSITKRFESFFATSELKSNKIILQKPQTYMNLSGKSVLSMCGFYKILPKNIIVIHDDLDLKIGEIRIKNGGGNAGHNGLKSIDDSIGNGYWRIRIGIGRPEIKEMVSSYVLSKFLPNEIAEIEKNLDSITKNIEKIMQN